jgi:hypothetical protein
MKTYGGNGDVALAVDESGWSAPVLGCSIPGGGGGQLPGTHCTSAWVPKLLLPLVGNLR